MIPLYTHVQSMVSIMEFSGFIKYSIFNLFLQVSVSLLEYLYEWIVLEDEVLGLSVFNLKIHTQPYSSNARLFVFVFPNLTLLEINVSLLRHEFKFFMQSVSDGTAHSEKEL